MSEFDGIDDFEGWSVKLMELLQDAQGAAQQQALGPRLAVCNRLTEFMARSSPNTPEVLALDGIANDAAAGLMRQVVEERLAEIGGRQADLIRLTKKVESTAEAAGEAAAGIRLDRARKAVGALTESILRLKELRDILAESGDASLDGVVEKLITAMQKARRDIENRA